MTALLCTALATVHCGSSSTAPTSTTPAVASVTVTSPTLAVGGAGSGTVTLASAATTAVTVTLASSNPAVATVPSTVSIAAGSSSAAFTITALAAGSASFTASLSGSSSQSVAVTVVAVRLATLTLSAATVVGGDNLTGTVTLTAAAPPGGASVTLTGSDPAIVSSSVTVGAGATSANFTVQTRVVGGTIPGTVTASYGGGTASVTVSVTKPTVATAVFGVTGPTESDTCTLTNSGTTINCTFTGSRSTAPGTIVAYDWTYKVASTFSQTTTGAVLAAPTVNCTLVPSPPLPAGSQNWLMMTVTLRVRDDQGNMSAVVSNTGVRLFPQGSCGY